MPFIPNYADAAVDPNQAEPDSGDFEILLAGTRGDGVLSGCAVTATVGFLPTDITGLLYWLKADSLSQSDNTDVTTWTDSSGNGRNGTGVGTTKPKYRTGIVNTQPAIQFNGTTAYVDMTTMTDPTIFKPSSVFYVLSCTDITNYRQIIGGNGTGGFYSLRLDQTNEKQTLAKHATALILTGTTGFTTSTWTVGQTDYGSAGEAAHYLNGTANGSATSDQTFSFSAATNYTFGGDVSDNFYFQGYIAEILAYDHVLSSGHKSLVTSYLGDKYGISVT